MRDSSGRLRSRLAKAEALREAKQWLRNLTRKEVEAVAKDSDATRGLKLELPRDERLGPDDKPFAHPYYWSAFILIGDPQ